MMKLLVFSFAIFLTVCMIFLNGCDTRRAGIEQMKKKHILTGEQEREQIQNTQKVMEQINAYAQDFGQYPASLEELKEAGYNFPAEPTAGWHWTYTITDAGPEVIPEPKP